MFDDLNGNQWWFMGIAALIGYRTVKHLMKKLPGNQPNNEAGAQAGPEARHQESGAQSDDPFARSAGGAPLQWHQVLEVGSGASLEEIRQAYKRKIRLYHPDKVAGLGPEFMAVAEAKAKEINEAYQQGCAARGSF